LAKQGKTYKIPKKKKKGRREMGDLKKGGETLKFEKGVEKKGTSRGLREKIGVPATSKLKKPKQCVGKRKRGGGSGKNQKAKKGGRKPKN